jgi:hypothetical protein
MALDSSLPGPTVSISGRRRQSWLIPRLKNRYLLAAQWRFVAATAIEKAD